MPGEYLQTEGTFSVEAQKPLSGWFGRSKEKQTPYIQIQFVVTDDVEESGKEITWLGYLSDKAIDRTVDSLVECFGFDGDLNALHAGVRTFEGMAAKIVVVAETYEGKRRCKVKWLNPTSYQGPPGMADEEVKILLAGIGGKVAQAAKICAAANNAAPAKPKPSAPTAKPVPQPTEDDVPF